MKRTLGPICFALAMVTVTANAFAATLPVSFTVDTKALKIGAPAGTILGVKLYTDSSCITVPVAKLAVAIENVSVTESLKAFTPKRAAAKPPITTRLNFVLEDVVLDAGVDLFLQVTGNGITAVGGDCQSQGATPAPPAGLSCVTTDVPCALAAGPLCTSQCPDETYQIMGGGCDCALSDNPIIRGQPEEATKDRYRCECAHSVPASPFLIHAVSICCK
ncbi:MAG: hypothetical protein HY899_07270 [Deltaproteobacteria bacterium]|nr:hypothetical protein [Deltaproteobacteria bacterium]